MRGLDKELIEKINNEIVDAGEQITFSDIAGLENAKKTVNELILLPMKRPDIFTGLRAIPKGLLLFGPPGTGMFCFYKYCVFNSLVIVLEPLFLTATFYDANHRQDFDWKGYCA